MFFFSLGAVTAMWLIVCPLLGIESDSRATQAVVVGLAALVSSVLAVRFRGGRLALMVLGVALAFANLAQPVSMLALANFATCAVALVAAGTTLYPTRVSAPAVAAGAEVRATSAPVPHPVASDEERTARLPHAA